MYMIKKSKEGGNHGYRARVGAFKGIWVEQGVSGGEWICICNANASKQTTAPKNTKTSERKMM